jgi:ribosomal protein S18 acetylase RimI-like enzyme
MFDIRIANENDIPLIRKLTFSVWPQTYAPILKQDQIDYMLDLMYSEISLHQQMQDGVKFIIIEEENNPVGFAGYQSLEKGIYKLHKLYVLPGTQGKGLGKYMIDHIFREMSENGGHILRLQVNRFNKAKEFYEKLGFYVTAEADFPIGNGYFMNDFIMEKTLPEKA